MISHMKLHKNLRTAESCPNETVGRVRARLLPAVAVAVDVLKAAAVFVVLATEPGVLPPEDRTKPPKEM